MAASPRKAQRVNELEVSYEGRRYSFAAGQTVRIGRSPDNDVVVSDPTVSRQHAQVTCGPDGWVFEGQGRAGTFVRGSTVTRLVLGEAVELSLASPQGPVLRLEPLPGPTRAAAGVLDPGLAGIDPAAPLLGSPPGPAAAPGPGLAPPPPAPRPAARPPVAPPPAAQPPMAPHPVPPPPAQEPAAAQSPQAQGPAAAQGPPAAWPPPAPPGGPPGGPAAAGPAAPGPAALQWAPGQAAAPPWGPAAQGPGAAPPWAPGAQGPAAPPWGPGAQPPGAPPPWGPGAQRPGAPPWGPGAGGVPPGARAGAPPGGSRDELASAFQILVPIKGWLTDPGWRQGLRLLVIPYALLPLIFIALFASSGNLTTPGWAYSLYVAPLWAIVFWLLIRPPEAFGRQEVLLTLGIIIWVMIWMSVVTININRHLNPRSFGDALAVGFNEEITKALPILVAALLLLKVRSVKLDARMWMFLGTIAGLTFGVREASQYTTVAIEHIAAAALAHSANEAVVGALSFAYRVFVDGFQHAIWAGISAFFIGIAVNYPRRRVPLIIFGISIAAVLHAVNDWYLSNFTSPWPWILLQAFSLFLFLGYTMSAGSIVRQVRRTPLFRGESMIMDKFTETGDIPKT
jgi:RsiW-degrading membrane proteinase PrsW (M82 family)